MKILHIITSLGAGGAEAVLYRMTEKDKINQHVVVSLMDEGIYGDLLKAKKINVYSINCKKGKLSIKEFLRIRKIIKIENPDAIQAWLYHAILAMSLVSKTLKIKNFFWSIHHSNTNDKSNFKTYLIIKIIGALSYFSPKKIIYCAQSSKSNHEIIGYNKNKGIVIYNGFDTELFTPKDKSLRKELYTDDSTFLIGFVARYDPIKDFDNFLKAIYLAKNNISNFKCVMAGKNVSYENKELIKKIKSYHLDNNIILLGLRNDIPNIMDSIDILVLSSKGEAFPNVLGEAMACQTPCITTDVGDASILVKESGWIVPASSPLELSHAINIAYREFHDKEKWNHRCKISRKTIIDNFSIIKMIESYNKCWID